MVYKRVQKNNSSSGNPDNKGTNKKSNWKNNWEHPFTESSFGIQPQADTDSTPHQGTNEYRSTNGLSRILANIQRQALTESQPSPLQSAEKGEEVSNEAVEIQRQSESSESGDEDSNSANGGTIQRFGADSKSELPVESSELEISPQTSTIQSLNTPEAQNLDQIASIQPKLTIGAPGDKYEQEADSMAERVMSMDAPTVQQQPIGRQSEEPEESIQRQPITTSITPLIQRFTEVIQRLTEKKLQAKAAIQTKGEGGASPATSDLESRLASQQGGGSPLDKETRSFMEPRFGNDFSSVKVHTDSSSVQMNKELGAQAFTHGHDVYFGAGKYNPGADDGKRLLAHELTHVVQQTGAVQPKSTPNQAFKKNKIQTKALLTPLSEAQSVIQHKKQNSPAQTKQNKQQQPKPSVPGADVETGKGQPQAPTGKNPAVAPQGGKGSVKTPATAQASGAGTGKASATVKAGGAAVNPQVKTKGDAKAPATVPAGGAAAASGEKAPATAESDPAYQAVISSAKGIGEQHKEHPPSESKAQEAQAAAESPSSEVDSKAQANQVGEMGQTETPEFDAAGFKAKLMARIADMAPKNLEEADNFKNNNQLESVKGDLSGQVKDEQKASKDPLEAKAKETPDTSGIEAKQVTPLPPNEPGAETSDIGADKAAPKPKSQEEVEAPLQAESQKLDQQMAEANVTEEQLSNSNEPAFQGALTAKKEAQTKAAQAPQEYRQQEEGLISNAKNTAVSTAQQLLQAMHGTRTQSLGQVATQQTEAKSKDEQARAKIAGDINKIYDNTKTKVEQSLADLDSLVLQAFDTGAGEAKKAFEDYVKQKMDAYKDERYSGLTGPAKWLKDKFMGLPSEVNVFYEEGRQLYIAKMDGVINNVVAIVSKGITKAKTEITNGKQEIQTYVQQLPEDLKAVGQEAATEIQTKFDDLQQQVNDKQDELVNTLAEKYQENLQAVDDSIEKMKSENKGLLQKAADAFMGVIKTILEMKDLLLSALAGAAAAVMDILKNPIQFLTNFIQAVKQGFLNFVKNIGQYLQQGLMAWLTGAIGGAGLQMPESFDIKGIFSLVTQVLGFSYDFIRGRAANKLGEEKVAYLEQSEETFKVLPTQGLAGIWHLIQDKIGDIKTTVMDGIQNFVMTSIVQAGVEWVLSLLTPASAFVKACKMIIDIVKFFIERGSQIAALIGAITSSISAIASGAVGEAIQAIESALARSIPVALGFLASLLGLGGISQKIQGIIQKVRQPVAKAVDWVIDKGAKVLNKVGGKFNKTKFGSKVAGVKNAAQEKYKAGKKFVEDKKAAGEKWFDDKKQAVHQATEKQKNRLLNTKAGKALTNVKDAAHKKLDALEKKRQAFKNKIDAAKEWPGKQLEKVQDKAAELGGRAKDKFKQSKLGKGFANQLDKAKDWSGKKKTAVQDWAKHKLGITKDKDVKNSQITNNKSGLDKDKNKNQHPVENKTPVEIPFSMKGEQHTLFLTSGETPSLEMASKRDRLSNKIGRAIAKLHKQSPKPDEQINALREIGVKAKKAQKFLYRTELTAEQRLTMKKEGEALAATLLKYSIKYDVSDIDGILYIDRLEQYGNRNRNLNVDPDGEVYEGSKRLDDAPIVHELRKAYNQLENWNIFIKEKHPELYEEFKNNPKFGIVTRGNFIGDIKKETKKFKEKFRNLERQDVSHLKSEYEKFVLETQVKIDQKIEAIKIWYKGKTGNEASNIKQEGDDLWRKAWEKAIIEVNTILATLWPPAKTNLQSWVDKQKVNYPEMQGEIGDLDYIGSLAKGYKGPPKQYVRFNPEDFDVDANLKAPPLATYAMKVKKLVPDRKSIPGRKAKIEPLTKFLNKVQNDLQKVKGFKVDIKDPFDVFIEAIETPEQEQHRTITEELWSLRPKLNQEQYKELLKQLKEENLLSDQGQVPEKMTSQDEALLASDKGRVRQKITLKKLSEKEYDKLSKIVEYYKKLIS